MSSLAFRKGDAPSCLVIEQSWDDVVGKPSALDEVSVRVLEMVRRAEYADILTRKDTLKKVKKILNECLLHPLKMDVAKEYGTDPKLYLTECDSGGDPDDVWYNNTKNFSVPMQIVFVPSSLNIHQDWHFYTLSFTIGSHKAKVIDHYDEQGLPVYKEVGHQTGWYRLGIVPVNSMELISQSSPLHINEDDFNSTVDFVFDESERDKQQLLLDTEYRFVFLYSDSESGPFSICPGLLLSVSTSATLPISGYIYGVAPYKCPIIRGQVEGKFKDPEPRENAIQVDALWAEVPGIPPALKEALERLNLMHDAVLDTMPLYRKNTTADVKEVVNETIVKPLKGINVDE